MHKSNKKSEKKKSMLLYVMYKLLWMLEHYIMSKILVINIHKSLSMSFNEITHPYTMPTATTTTDVFNENSLTYTHHTLTHTLERLLQSNTSNNGFSRNFQDIRMHVCIGVRNTFSKKEKHKLHESVTTVQ